MSRTSQLFARVMVGSVLSVLPLGGWALWAEDVVSSVPPRGSIWKYDAPSGDTYVAIGIRATGLPETKVARQHVVLIDTSASQFGEHRAHGLAMLGAFLSGLPADDQVTLFAVDVQATQLTSQFVAPNSDEVRDAVATLRKRVPLGATNFQIALDAARQALPKDSAATVLYVGDGLSAVNLLSSETVRDAITDLRDRHVSFSSYAVGPRHDLRLLGVMAQHTGGVLLIDSFGDPKTPANQPGLNGQQLATAVTAPVFYPDRLEIEGAAMKLATSSPLPLRSDRETILIAQGQLTDNAAVVATGQMAGEPTRQRWTNSELANDTGSPFLATVWRQAEKDGGLVPFAGSELLGVARREFQQRMEFLSIEGSQALSRKQYRDAEKAGLALQELDPDNANAKLLLTAGKGVTSKRVAQLAQGEEPNTPAQPPAAGSLLNRDDLPRDVSSGTRLIIDQEERQHVIGEKLKLEVSRAIQEARAIANSEPDAALSLLKRAYGTVRATADASIDLRQQLSRQLQGVIADVRSQKDVAEQNQVRLQERISVQEAEKRLLEKLQLEDEKLEQLVDRVRALLEEGARGNDEAYAEAESAAEVAVQMRPHNIVANAVRFNSEAAHQLHIALRLRALRAEKFLATLEQVEYSHVPFPDEPPVLFPPPEVWKALTERRKPYASVDLHKSSPAERRIAAALDEQTEIQFSDTPLTDVLTFLQDYHNIPIILDTQALQDEGIATDDPITRTLSGVTLRSALKIMLQPKGLTYVIEDEVMKITTTAKENEKLQTRVYPVGDLVVQLQSSGGGGGGFGFGGGGGGLGGGGLGGGGLGGGGLGGGGFGGGGGIFNVPVNFQAPQRRAAAAPFGNQQVEASKKKPTSK